MAEMAPELSHTDCTSLTPLVRAHLREGLLGTKADLLCIAEESVLAGRFRMKDRRLLQQPDVDQLRQNLRSLREIGFADITQVDVYPGGRRTRLARVTIRGAKRSIKARVPQDDLEHLVGLLHTRLGDRFKLHHRVPLQGWGLSFLILLILSAAGCLVAFAPEAFLSAVIMIVACLPLMLVQFIDHTAAPFPWTPGSRSTKKTGKDRSGVLPFRSKFIGWMLKFLAAAGLLVLWAMGALLFAPLLLLLLYLGHLLAQTPLKLVRDGDQRPPILYLRSFFDDRKTTLMPVSRYAYFMGVQPPQYLPAPWRYIFFLNPVRIFRILFGLGTDTSEEQLGLFFRKHGPFVAIGKPGETFASPGASRMYVTNEEWQDVVLDHLEKSQIVLLQPAQTEGVWWEVEKTLQQVDPRKVLFCMVNFHRKQNDYEKFRLRAEKFLQHPLPKNVSYTTTPAFIYFDQDWRPSLQEVSCHPPVIWPLLGEPVDLNYTLAPFLASVRSGEVNALIAEQQSQTDDPTTDDPSTESSAGNFSAMPSSSTTQSTEPRAPRGLGQFSKLIGGMGYLGVLFMLSCCPGFVNEARQAAQRADQKNLEGNPWPDEEEVALNTNRPAAGSGGEPSDDHILQSEPSDAAGWQARGKLHGQQGNHEQAVADLTQAIELDPADAESLVLRGDSFDSLGRLEEARADYSKAIELDPKHANAQNNFGFSLTRTKHFDEAIEHYSRAIELDPDDSVYYSNRGMAYLSYGKPDQALADFQHALKLQPQNSILYIFAGRALADQSEWLEAIKHFNTAVQLNPEEHAVYWHRAKAFVAIGDQKSANFNPYEFARRDANIMLEHDPDDTRALLARATINSLDGRLEDCIADATELLKREPDNIDALDARLNAHLRSQHFDQALNDCDRFLRAAPENPGFRSLRVTLLLRLERYDDTIAAAELILQDDPQNINIIQIQGNAYLLQGSFAEANMRYAAILKIDPENVTALTTYAQTLANTGEYELAEDPYTRLVAVQPNHFDPTFFLLYDLAELQKWEAFEATAKQLFDGFDNHENSAVQVNLLRLNLLHSPDNIDWAPKIVSAQTLAKAHPDIPLFAIVLGALQVRAKQYAEAEATLKTVMELDIKPLSKAHAQVWLSQAEAGLERLPQARLTLNAAKTWAAENCPPALAEGQPESNLPQWWERTELHTWISAASDLVAEMSN